MLSDADWVALQLTLRLALTVTVMLLIIGTPLAWWLSRTRSFWKKPVSALVALPLVLPPTVIGFYLLIGFGPEGPLGRLTQALGLGLIPFTYTGLVVASMLYSLPFVVQPLHTAFESLGERPMEVAATLRAAPLDRFFTVIVPLSRSGFLTATVLGFAHTVGEFGVVLMIGGSIPGETRLVSMQIYDHVEAFDYAAAHGLAGFLLLFSFLVLLALYATNPRLRRFP